MPRFLDVRLSSTGGDLAASVAINQGTAIGNYQSLDKAQLVRDIQGQNVLIATHGFNVNRADGIAHLSNWETQLQLHSVLHLRGPALAGRFHLGARPRLPGRAAHRRRSGRR